MKALVAINPKQIKFLDVKKYEATENMVLVRVSKAGICATDYSIYTGESSFVADGSIKYPVRFGHEWSGVVEAVGENVSKFKVGDKVVSDSGFSCGVCDVCKKGDLVNCPHIKSVGTVNTWDGCFAEYMLVPDYHLYKLPNNVSLTEGALIEPTTISYDAFTDAGDIKGKTVVVMGTGAIGLSSVWLAKYFGAETVAIVGRDDHKLLIAKKVGADVIINNKREDVLQRVLELTEGIGADMTIEASGSDSLLIDSFNVTKRYGRVSVLGFYEKNIDNVPIDNVVLKCLTVRGAAGCKGYPEKVIEIMKKNPMKLTPIITHTVPFENAIDVFEDKNKYKTEIKIKVILDMDGEE